MWVIRCRSVIINPWQNPAAVPYKIITSHIPLPALGYNQRAHASPPAWQQLHVDLQKGGCGGVISRVRWEIYIKRNKNQYPYWNDNGLDELD